MFAGLRKNAKFVIYIIAGVFILSMAIGGVSSMFFPKQHLGVIAGEAVEYDQFKELMTRSYAAYQQQNPDAEIDDKVMKQLSNEAWNNLYNKAIKKRRIKVTDADIYEKLKNPSDEIKAAEQFMTDGEFDYSKYQTALLENERFADYLEAQARGNLPYEKLFDDVKSEVVLTEEDVRADYEKTNDKADAKIIFFNSRKIDDTDVTVTEEEIEKYYNDNKEDYKKDPSAQFDYVKIVLKASDADANLVKTRIDSVYNVVVGGMDFAEAAKQYSEGPSAPKGGDLGYFTKDRMVTPFANKAFEMNVGDISEPVLTQFGWHIIKVYDIRTNDQGNKEVKASHILLETKPSEETKQNLSFLAMDLYEKASSSNLVKAAEELAYEASETSDFYENSTYISGIGRNEDLVKFAFDNKKGAITDPIKLDNGDYVICQIKDKKGVHYQELDAVSKRIESTLKNEKKTELAQQKAEEFYKNVPSEEYLAKAEEYKAEIIEAKDIWAEGSITTLGKDEDINNAILAVDENHFSEVIKSSKGGVIAFVTKRTAPDMENFDKNKETIIAEAQEKAENEHLNEWWKVLRETAEIEDHRADYDL